MKRSATSNETARLVRFGAAGTLNTAICYALFALLVEVCAWHYNVALVVDYGAGIVLGYLLHRATTFADCTHLRRPFGKYVVTIAATFAANLAMLDAIVRWQWLAPVAAQAVAMTAVTLASYLAQKHWVFRSHAAAAKVATDEPPLSRAA